MAIFDEAQKQANAAKARALKALAEGGTAGLRAQQAADQQMVQGRQAAVQNAMQRAAVIGAPAEHVAELSSTVATPFDRRRPVLAAAGDSRNAALKAIESANSNYFDQLNAALPVVQANAESRRTARIKAEEESTIGDVLREAGGVDLVGNLIRQQAALLAPQMKKSEYAPVTLDLPESGRAFQSNPKPGTFNFVGNIKHRQATEAEAADELGEALGLPAGYGSALAGEKKEPALNQAQRRANVVQRVDQYASPNTKIAFNEIVGASSNLAKALSTLESIDKETLKKDGVSVTALKRWIADYYGQG